MKTIMNIGSLEKELLNENPNWKQAIYDELGIWINVKGERQRDWELVSAVGGFYGAKDMDDDLFGTEDDGSCEIHSVSDLIAYIRGTEIYRYCLQDVSLGAFRKSELFWAIESRIMAVNTDADGRIYGLSGICGPGEPYFNDMQQDDLWLDFAAIAYDEISGIYLTKEHQLSLDAAVSNIAEQLKEFRDIQDWTPVEVPLFKYNAGADFYVPATMEELIDAYNMQKDERQRWGCHESL